MSRDRGSGRHHRHPLAVLAVLEGPPVTSAHVPCPECGGHGKLDQGHDIIDCPACYGNGWVQVDIKHPPTPLNAEQNEILGTFMDLLRVPTGDGAVKRAAGQKTHWKVDEHDDALFRHLQRWQDGDRYDATSGAHALAHVAWRALAIAYQEMQADGLIPDG